MLLVFPLFGGKVSKVEGENAWLPMDDRCCADRCCCCAICGNVFGFTASTWNLRVGQIKTKKADISSRARANRVYVFYTYFTTRLWSQLLLYESLIRWLCDEGDHEHIQCNIG